jgi:hypothetical protein
MNDTVRYIKRPPLAADRTIDTYGFHHKCMAGRWGGKRWVKEKQVTHKSGRDLFKCVQHKAAFSGEGDRWGCAAFCHVGDSSVPWPVVHMYQTEQEAQADPWMTKRCDAFCELPRRDDAHRVVEIRLDLHLADRAAPNR